MPVLIFLISFIGSSTLGQHFNPAQDCSDIIDNLPGAKDGFYWIKPTKGKLLKVNIFQSQYKKGELRNAKGSSILLPWCRQQQAKQRKSEISSLMTR